VQAPSSTPIEAVMAFAKGWLAVPLNILTLNWLKKIKPPRLVVQCADCSNSPPARKKKFPREKISREKIRAPSKLFAVAGFGFGLDDGVFDVLPLERNGQAVVLLFEPEEDMDIRQLLFEGKIKEFGAAV